MIKELWSSFLVCFSMYSVVPMGKNWFEKASMRYVLCFLPLVGVVIGGLEAGWLWLARSYAISGVLYGAVATLLQVAVSGGIHLDGLIDSCDATASYGDREKRLEILADPHVGAFGILYCCGYLLLTLGLYAQLFSRPAGGWVLLGSFALSRALAGLVTLGFPTAKSSGLGSLFAQASEKIPTRVVLTLWAALLLLLGGMRSLPLLLSAAVGLAVLVISFYRFIQKNFGGLTGDLIGLFLCLVELLLLLCATLAGLCI